MIGVPAFMPDVLVGGLSSCTSGARRCAGVTCSHVDAVMCGVWWRAGAASQALLRSPFLRRRPAWLLWPTVFSVVSWKRAGFGGFS